MSNTVTWTILGPGRYSARYLGKALDIHRNDDPNDRRRYVALVDGQAWPQPCWTVSQAKTRCLRWARDGAGYVTVPRFETAGQDQPFDPIDARFDEIPPGAAGAGAPGGGALVPYGEAEPPGEDACIDVPYAITGTMRVADLGDGLVHLRTALELLRECGPAEAHADLPPRVKV